MARKTTDKTENYLFNWELVVVGFSRANGAMTAWHSGKNNPSSSDTQSGCAACTADNIERKKGGKKRKKRGQIHKIPNLRNQHSFKHIVVKVFGSKIFIALKMEVFKSTSSNSKAKNNEERRVTLA